MKITIKDVAERAGVSKTTVSRILNGNYAHTKEETKQRVLQVIKELNYQPNALAKGLKLTKTNVVGIILSDLKNPFWAEVLEGVEDTCRHYGYQLMICNSNEDPTLEESSINALQLRQVDGIAVNPTVKNESLFMSLVDAQYPLVLVNRKLQHVNVDSVLMDNVKGASLAVEHLLETGRSKIAVYVYQNEHVTPWKERLAGYRETLLKHGYQEKDLIIHYVKQERGEVKDAVIRNLQLTGQPDAIFSTNNMMTLEIIDGIKAAGLRIPDDLALVSYDDTVWTKHLNPPLTTVEQPGYEMGKIAAERLIKIINAEEKQMPLKVILDPRLIVRESTSVKTPSTVKD